MSTYRTGDEVTFTDIHGASLTGEIVKIVGGLARVEDGDGDPWMVRLDRVAPVTALQAAMAEDDDLRRAVNAALRDHDSTREG